MNVLLDRINEMLSNPSPELALAINARSTDATRSDCVRVEETNETPNAPRSESPDYERLFAKAAASLRRDR
jgi:hypothetical protein